MSKIKLQDFVQFGRLFETYGNLLSEDRQKIMTDYFQFNMTLAEIAKERNISRQAVLDAIDKSCQKLQKFEALLEITSKKEMLQADLAEIGALAKSNECGKIIEKVEKIMREI